MACECKDSGRLPGTRRAIEEEMREAVSFDEFVD